MNKFRLYSKTHPNILKIFILGYIIFAGCVIFPFGNDMFPFDLIKLYLVIGSYGIIGSAMARLYGKYKYKIVYISSLMLTALGMICRYFINMGKYQIQEIL